MNNSVKNIHSSNNIYGFKCLDLIETFLHFMAALKKGTQVGETIWCEIKKAFLLQSKKA